MADTGATWQPVSRPLVSLADLPKPWLYDLILCWLSSSDRLAVFSTCRALSATVVHSTPRVNIRACPNWTDTDITLVAGLAAGCTNVHWCLTGPRVQHLPHGLQLSITHLTLQDSILDSFVCHDLPLSKLCNLQTLSLTSSPTRRTRHGELDENALASVVNSLPALKTLVCEFADEADAHRGMEKLAPVLGPHITCFVVNHARALAYLLKHFPQLQSLRVTVTARQALPGVVNRDMVCALIKHPHIRHITLPNLHLDFRPEDTTKPCCWSTLHVTSPNVDFLAHAPLSTLRCLRIEGGIRNLLADEAQAEQAMINLSKVAKIDWVPCMGESARMYGLAPEVPVWVLEDHLYPPLVALCTQHLHGAVYLWCIHMTLSQLPALQALPTSIHTIAISNWWLDDATTWPDVWRHLPSHIDHLMISHCEVSKLDMLDLLTRHAPSGLRNITWHVKGGVGLQQPEVSEQAAVRNISLHMRRASW